MNKNLPFCSSLFSGRSTHNAENAFHELYFCATLLLEVVAVEKGHICSGPTRSKDFQVESQGRSLRVSFNQKLCVVHCVHDTGKLVLL